MRGVHWTAKMDAELRAMAADGKSASKAGRALGYTRSAVLGRAHRLGIKFKGYVVAAPKPAKIVRATAVACVRRPDGRKRHSNETKAKAARLYADGVTLAAISAATGVPMGSLPQMFGHLPRRRNVIKGKQKTRKFRVMAMAAALCGKPQSAVAETLGFHPKCFTYWKRSDPALMADAEAIASQVRAAMEAKALVQHVEATQKAKAYRASIEAINAPILTALPRRSREMMRRRIDGETLQSIATTYGLTRERIRQIEKRCRALGLVIADISLPEPPPANRAERDRRLAFHRQGELAAA